MSSKIYKSNFCRKNRKRFKRNNRKYKQKSITYSKNNKKHEIEISFKDKILFPSEYMHIYDFIEILKNYKKEDRLVINHRGITNIDNISILLLTAGINLYFPNKSLHRDKRLAPIDKNINSRLNAIGYWEALCFNPPNINKNLDYLRIRKKLGSLIDNELHADIVNFFSDEHNIKNDFKDALFDAIYEAMANAAEHAFINKNDNEKIIWFLGSYSREKRELEFIFYDTGIGIFKSLENKSNTLGKILIRYAGMYGRGNALKKMCNNDLSKYKMKDKKARGLGIIAFKDFIDKISKTRLAYFEVATSNVVYLSKNDKIRTLQKPITGTLVRWVIGDENAKQHK